MGGGMEANKNRFVEEWGAARENLEHNFRWTCRNFAIIGIFGIAIPVLVYKGIVREFATLGLRAATKRSILQCNVGNKSLVYLCCLYPEKNECLQQHLEFDEAVNHSGAKMPDDLSLPSTEVGPGNSDKPKICGSDAN